MQIATIALAKATYNVFLRPLAAYPGPVVHRASELPRLLQEVTGNTVHKWAELHAKYGPVVRIAPGQLSYISNDAWRDIYAAKGTFESPDLPNMTAKTRQMSGGGMAFPGDEFEFFGSGAKPMISCDSVNHARHRRIIGSAFSDAAVRAYEPVLVERTTLLLRRLEEHAVKRQAVDAVAWFNFAMFDITSILVFGRSSGETGGGVGVGCFGCLERGGGTITPGLRACSQA